MITITKMGQLNAAPSCVSYFFPIPSALTPQFGKNPAGKVAASEGPNCTLEYDGGLNNARTSMGKGASLGPEAVLAASGQAGEKSDFFRILLRGRYGPQDRTVPHR